MKVHALKALLETVEGSAEVEVTYCDPDGYGALHIGSTHPEYGRKAVSLVNVACVTLQSMDEQSQNHKVLVVIRKSDFGLDAHPRAPPSYFLTGFCVGILLTATAILGTLPYIPAETHYSTLLLFLASAGFLTWSYWSTRPRNP